MSGVVQPAPGAEAHEERARDDPAGSGAEARGNRRHGSEPSALEHGEVALLDEIQEAPVTEQVEHIVHGEIGEGEQQDVAVLENAADLAEADAAVRLRASGLQQ